MKRDMDLARKILEQVEEKSKGVGVVNLDIPNYPPDEVSYNVMLLAQAGLLKANDCTSSMGLLWIPRTLTWTGHEFLDAIRNDTVWNKVKETAKEKGGAITFEAIKALAAHLAVSIFTSGS